MMRQRCPKEQGDVGTWNTKQQLNEIPPFLLALLLFSVPLLAFTVPPLTQPVMDTAGMMSPATQAKLNRVLAELKSQGGSQIAILTVPTLDGLTIEEASIKVAGQWQLGSAAADNGVLLLIAQTERALRIEVGQGREGDLPDAYARRIIDDKIVPYFKAGQVDDGVLVGVYEIIRRTDPTFDIASRMNLANVQSLSGSQRSHRSRPGILMLLLLGAVIFINFISNSFSGRRHFGGRRGGFGGGGGFGNGGGFGGGGGFSGGGGGFSGGGASGRW